MDNREDILNFIKERLVSILGVDGASLNEDTKFADLNMKSINFAQLTTALEDACDVEVPYMEFGRHAETLGTAADFAYKLATQ